MSTHKLFLYNSLSRKKEEFVPVDPNHVRLYACGPTVYNYAHIGNARMAVVFDVWSKVLKALYPKVTYVSNITDVDDKIMVAARETGENISDITQKYAQIYNDDMAALGVAIPDIQPKATEHIPEMIAQIEQLIKKGHAYQKEQHVLFDVPSFENYGKLSGRSREEQIAGARVEIAPYKKDPADFVLWKPSQEDEPGWDSPWGYGRPGWHIECSAMSEKHLGLPFDIHGGGADLKFPHHENEIAQSCCSHGSEKDLEGFSKYWVHNGFVTVEGEKMSKSLGNFLLVHDLIQEYPGEVLRLTMLTAQYRQPLDWAQDTLQQNKRLLERLYTKLKDIEDTYAGFEDEDQNEDLNMPWSSYEYGESLQEAARHIPQAVMDALLDDLNIPKAISEMCSLLKQDNSVELYKQLRAAGHVLGVLKENPKEWLGYAHEDNEDSKKIEELLEQRSQAKKNKDFAQADKIRDILLQQGIVIEDTPEGTKWKLKG